MPNKYINTFLKVMMVDPNMYLQDNHISFIHLLELRGVASLDNMKLITCYLLVV